MSIEKKQSLAIFAAINQKKIFFLFFLFASLPFLALSNGLKTTGKINYADRPISGRVVDQDGNPLAGASISIKGTGNGTSTNKNGEFNLMVPDSGNTYLVVSYVGYETQEVAVGNNTTLTISLKLSIKLSDQVIVVGYGTQRKVDVTSSIAHVKGDDLVKQPVVTVTQGLQGKVSGVQITSSGQPGSSPQVIIRGSGSLLNGVKPLYVVDGVILPDGSDITNINTSDIAAVDILKDASSTAIYGARAANGVILITTKQGSGKMKVSYNTDFGFSQASYILPMANAKQYLNYRSLATGLPVAGSPYSTDWFKQVLRNAFYQDQNISISGSNEKNRYLFSASYLTDEGIIIGNDYNRYTIRFNNEFTPTSFIKIGTTASYSNQATQNVPAGTITEDAYRASPIIPGIINGKYGNTSGYQNVGNPILDAYNTNDLSLDNRGIGNAYIEVKPVKSITLKSSLGAEIDFYNDRKYTYQHPNDTTFFINVNSQNGTQGASVSTLVVERKQDYNWVWDNTISFDKTFGRNKVTLLAGTTAEEYYTTTVQGTVNNVPADPNEWYLSDGDPTTALAPTSSNGNVEDKITRQSYLGRAFYSYADRYLFTFTFRRDGSSVFAPQNQYGNFPGVSAGWVITKENFMQNQHIFQYLKLRGGYGEVGNSNILSSSAFNTLFSRQLPYFYSSGNSGQGGTGGSAVLQIKDQNIVWETTKETDIGLEYGVFNGKLTGEMDVYDKKVVNALIPIYVAGTFGSQPDPTNNTAPGYVVYNAAVIDNKGFEFSARWQDKIGKNFSYFISGNASFNKNRVIALNNGSNGNVPFFDGNVNGYDVTETKPGYPIGSFFVRQVVGVFQSTADVNAYTDKKGDTLQKGAMPGDFKYKFNDNGVLDTVYAGSYQPVAYLGFSAGFTYKSFDFSFDIYANIGNQVYNGKAASRTVVSDNVEASVATSYWTAQNKSETQPAPNSSQFPFPASTYFIASGSFVRLNNVTLGYTVNNKILSRQHVITGFRVFANVQNLLTIKKYSGFSSELPGSNATNAGIDLNTYPTARTYAFGAAIGF